MFVQMHGPYAHATQEELQTSLPYLDLVASVRVWTGEKQGQCATERESPAADY